MATVYHCYTSYGTAPAALPPFDDDGGYHFAFYCSFHRIFPGNYYPNHLRSPEPPILCVIILPCHCLFHSALAAAAVQQLISEMGVRLPPEFVRSLCQTVSSMAVRAAAFPNLATSRILPIYLQIVAESSLPYSDVALTYPLTWKTRCGRDFDDVDAGDDDDHHQSSSVGSDLDHDHVDDDDYADNDEAFGSVSSSTSSELVSCNDDQTGQNKSTVTATSGTSTESIPNSDESESESESEERGEREEDVRTVNFDREADLDWLRRLIEDILSSRRSSDDSSINFNEDSDHDHDHDEDDDEGVDDDDVFEDDWNTDDDESMTVPASQSAIRALEEVDTTTLVAVDNRCIVCLDDFSAPRGHTDGEEEIDDHRVVRMPCSHVYHRDCIVTWLERSHLCPICRFPLPTSASN